MFKVPNEYRIQVGELGSTEEMGNNGAFLIPYQSFTLRVIASDGQGWEHVSVSLQNRTPELARDVFHQRFILGRGGCGDSVSPEKE
jgi:hypothetical protein